MTDKIEETIRNHFINGEKNHYSRNHIRESLMRKGYDPVKVQMVYNMLNLEDSQVQREVVVDNKKLLSSPVLPVIGGVVLALVIFFGIAMLVPDDASSVTGHAIADAKEKTTEGLDQVNTLNEKIDRKQEQILAQLQIIHEKDMTIEEKEKIITEQLEEINKIQGYLEEEQNHLRQSLLSLLDTLSERPGKALKE